MLKVNTLVIWNEISQPYIEKVLFLLQKIKKDENLIFVTNARAMEEINLNKIKPKSILILVELLWDNEGFFGGYHIALDLLQSSFAKDHPLQISFFSFFSRAFLFKKNKKITNIFPYSFPHNHLPIRENEEIKIPMYSFGRWKFIRKYGITLKGILDKILHDYNRTLKKPKLASPERVANLISRLEGVSDLMGAETQIVLNKIKTKEDYVEYINELLPLIHKIIMQTTEKEDEVNIVQKKSWRPAIMIVEDNHDFSEIIKNKLETYFDTTSFVNGLKAIKELELNGYLYDGLICDLELLEEEGFEQEKHGLDVIDYAQKNLPSLVINVLTNMPKTGVKGLLPNNLGLNNIQYKSAFEIHQTYEWRDYINFLKTEFRNSAKNKMIPGPNTSIWKNVSRQKNDGGGLKLFYYTFKQHNSEGFEKFWKNILSYYESVMVGDENISSVFPKPTKRIRFIDNYPEEEIRNYLKTFLLHRLFWLNKLYKGSKSSYYLINDEDTTFFDKRFSFFKTTKAKSDRRHSAYATLLGFTIIKKSESKYIFRFNMLFPKEIEWIKNTQKDTPIDFINAFSYIRSTLFKILSVIEKAHTHAFIKTSYQTPIHPENLTEVEAILVAFKKEPTKTTLYSDRQRVINLLRDFCENATEEFNELPMEYTQLIDSIISRLDVI